MVIAGAKMSGMATLVYFLKQHPQVNIHKHEMHYYDQHFDLGPEWYLRQMHKVAPWQVVVENTPEYFITPSAPGEIYYKVC